MSSKIPSPKAVGKGITKAGSSKSIGKIAGTSKTNYIKGKNNFSKGDKSVKVPNVAKKGTDGHALRNNSPMTDGRQFTGTSAPDAKENIRSKSDIVKTVLWEPAGAKTKDSRKLTNKKGSK